MKIAYVLYPDFTALDLVGPYEVITAGPAPRSTSWHARWIPCAAIKA